MKIITVDDHSKSIEFRLFGLRHRIGFFKHFKKGWFITTRWDIYSPFQVRIFKFAYANVRNRGSSVKT